ncbi:MAG: DUF6883 domain-containing protein [Crocosphaera sp.]|jgi:hypothetical protein
MIYLDSDAIIPEAKLTQYLLVKLPKNDKSGYLSQAGYTIDNSKQLEQQLRQQLTLPAMFDQETQFGAIYKIEGILEGTNGINLKIATFWIIDIITKETRFVTLLPN